MSKLIVGVFGTQCVGKSTFINDVLDYSEQHLSNEDKWTSYGDDYRDIIKARGLSINRNGNEECQTIIHNCLLNNICKAVDEFDKRMIMDRTVIDSFVYTYWLYKYKGCNIREETIRRMFDQMCRYAKTYNALLFIPLSKCDNVRLVDDKFRDTNEQYRQEIDDIMESVAFTLMSEGCNIMRVSGTRTERVAHFYDVVVPILDEGVLGRVAKFEDFSI